MGLSDYFEDFDREARIEMYRDYYSRLRKANAKQTAEKAESNEESEDEEKPF